MTSKTRSPTKWFVFYFYETSTKWSPTISYKMILMDKLQMIPRGISNKWFFMDKLQLGHTTLYYVCMNNKMITISHIYSCNNVEAFNSPLSLLFTVAFNLWQFKRLQWNNFVGKSNISLILLVHVSKKGILSTLQLTLEVIWKIRGDTK